MASHSRVATATRSVVAPRNNYAKLRLILILMQENKLVFLSLFLLQATYVGQANRQLPDINSWPHISQSVVVQQQGRHIHSYTNTYC